MYAAVIPKFITSLKSNKLSVINGNGSFSRDFTHVSNAVFANYLALTTTNTKCFGTVFNIGAGGRVSILEMYNIIKELMNSQLDPVVGNERAGDIPHSSANIDKAKQELGYEPLITFYDGMKLTVDYFNQ